MTTFTAEQRVLRAAMVAAGLLVFSEAVLGQALSGRGRDLGDLSLEQLSNIVVSSVSGRAEPLARALGSIYVITGDDIRRSGATSLPEALRLAPNLQVARTGASGYAITARGFNGVFANKLLVLIDGRSVYTPTFSGVFWDAQSVMLEDIERIEVISGPGGVLWGANAVNGVINVITKSSTDTQDGLVTAGGGNTELRSEFRYGGKDGRYRVYAQAFRLDDTEQPDGTDNFDGMSRVQAGVRADWASGPDAFTLQGDLYTAETDQEPEPQELRGANVLMRWNRDLGDGAGLRAQAYYDYSSRERQKLDTVDLELAQALGRHGRNTLLWGGGFRRMRDRVENAPAFAFLPAEKTLTNWNLYLQDVVAFRNDLDMTFGARVDHNSYTGFEFLPSIRIGWRPAPDNLIWAAASRAVRTPSRFDTELFIPGVPPFLLAGGPDFESELSNVFEIGYRGQPAERWSWAATVFYSELDEQRSIAPGPTAAVVANDLEGHSEGIEGWGAFRIFDGWRVWAGYTYLHTDLRVRPGAIDLQPPSSVGSDPRQWAKLRSAWDLGRAVELDVLIRYYDELENIAVPSYTAVDVRAGWRATTWLDVSLLVQNVLDRGHIEWSPGAEFERAAFLKALFRF